MTTDTPIRPRSRGPAPSTGGSDRDTSGLSWSDLRQAVRALRRRPASSLFIVLILALGIGATTALASFVYGVFLRPLPYPDGDRLVVVISTNAADGAIQYASYPDIEDWRRRSEALGSLAAMARSQQLNLEGDPALRVGVNFIDPELFRLLDARAAEGSLFGPSQADEPVAVLAHDLWRSRFAADPAVIGRSITLHETPVTVVGVLTPDFQDLVEEVQVYVPVALAGVIHRPAYLEARGARWLSSVGRLAPGWEVDPARRELEELTARMAEEYPESNEGFGVSVRSIRSSRFDFAAMRLSVLMLLVGSLLVLGIGCADVANLLLLRTADRRREIALRSALGAGRGRLAGQLLAESVLLALLGGILGLVLAALALRPLVRLADEAYDLPAFLTVAPHPGVFAASLGLALLVGLLVGLVSLGHGLRPDLSKVLQESGVGAGGPGGRGGMRRVMIVVAVACAVVLTTGAGLVLSSTASLAGEDPGFSLDDTVIARFELPAGRYGEPERSAEVYRGLQDRALAIEGVRGAGLWAPGIPGASHFYKLVAPEGGDPRAPEERQRVFEHRVTPGLLEAMEIPLLAGRYLEESDDPEHPPVALVSRSAARALWPGEEPLDALLGRRFELVTAGTWVTVVGVVEDTAQRGRLLPENDVVDDVYFPLVQNPSRNATLVLATDRSPEGLVPELERLVGSAAPGVPVYEVTTLERQWRREEAPLRFDSLLMLCFAAIALLLAVAGIYGVISRGVQQRRREIGLRMALGAERGAVVRSVFGEVLVLVALGLAVGWGGAVVLARGLQGLLYGVQPLDLEVFLGVTLALALVALLAGLAPAWRAAGVDPAGAIRS